MIVVVSALCADVEPQARHYNKLGHCRRAKFLDAGGQPCFAKYMAQRQVSPERKTAYYIGTGMMVVGLLCFGSVFVTGALHFGDFDNFAGRARSGMARAIIGMGLMIAGTIVRNAGRWGLAGSGIKLDPEEARKDVEPWARMGGGVLKDGLDEAGISLGNKMAGSEPLPFDERLRRLQKLRQDGLVSEAEFEAAKKKILDQA